jgi:hypothetical protein
MASWLRPLCTALPSPGPRTPSVHNHPLPILRRLVHLAGVELADLDDLLLLRSLLQYIVYVRVSRALLSAAVQEERLTWVPRA